LILIHFESVINILSMAFKMEKESLTGTQCFGTPGDVDCEGDPTLVISSLLFRELTEILRSEQGTGIRFSRVTHEIRTLEMNANSYRLPPAAEPPQATAILRRCCEVEGPSPIHAGDPSTPHTRQTNGRRISYFYFALDGKVSFAAQSRAATSPPSGNAGNCALP
jgi:hypothetical protein